MTIGEQVRLNARRYPSKVAVVDLERRLTYAELELRTNRLAHGLGRLGVQRGENVGMLVGNSVLFVMVPMVNSKRGFQVGKALGLFRSFLAHRVNQAHMPTLTRVT